jgi:PAS domain S-box-containing protein
MSRALRLTNRSLTILIVEETTADADALRHILAKDKDVAFTLRHAERLSVAKQFLEDGDIDVVLLDLTLPDSEGLATLSTLRAAAPLVPVIVLASSDDEELALRALQKGAQDYLLKGHIPIYCNLLGRTLRYAIDRKRSEEALREASAQTDQLLSSLTSILIGIGPGGLVTYWNRVAAEVFGVSGEAVCNRLLWHSGLSMDLPRVLEGVNACRATGQPVRLDEVTFTKATGKKGFLGFTAIPIRGGTGGRIEVLLFGADVTPHKEADAERARLQEQLAQSQKMEMIGRFAGGIAHDFHNFLMVMRGFAELIGDQSKGNADVADNVQEILRAADSALGLVNQILAFSRRQVLNREIIDLNQTIRGMQKFLQQLVGEFVRVELDLDSAPLRVKADPTGLEQIVMNLSTNARDAMGRKGALIIRTRRLLPDDLFRAAHPWAGTAPYVQLTIRDTGVGMEPGMAERIFEPFFTTKQLGRGTGLGLAVVYGLVQQQAGSIEVDTAIGKGTAFHIYLPEQATGSDHGREAGGASTVATTIINGAVVTDRPMTGRPQR